MPVYVHADEVPMAAGKYLPQYAMPLDRWLVVPVMRLLPSRTRERIEAAGSITDVVRPLDPQAGVRGLPDWECVPTPGHTPGHVAYLRRSDGVLIAGDAALTVDLNSVGGVLGAPYTGLKPTGLDLAVAAERHGWDGCFLWDHILGRCSNPCPSPTPGWCWEPSPR